MQKGQAVILTIFVIGMVGLLIGISLSKTGFSESLMGRGANKSAYAFYVANSGVEEAFYKIKHSNFGYPSPQTFELNVGEGSVKVTVSGGKDERSIQSVGKFGKYTRKLKVSAYNTEIKPGFARAIQAGQGGIEFENRTIVTGRDKTTGTIIPVDVYSNSFIRGRSNGKNGETDCSKPASTTRIAGNIFAVGSVERLDTGNGPCIDGNAYSGSLKECRVFGKSFSSTPISDSYCPNNGLCDPSTDPENCKSPVSIPLPDIGVPLIKKFLASEGTTFKDDCVIGGSPDCSTLRSDGKRELGNIIITGNLSTNLSSYYISGPVLVQKDFTIASNQTISLSPESSISSLIILVGGKINTSSNVTFTSTGKSFLMLASEYSNSKPDVCADTEEPAIKIASNVNSILFYAINGCASVENPTASAEFYGAILGEGIKLKNNAKLIYDPALKDAEFFLRKKGGWQISSFTQQ